MTVPSDVARTDAIGNGTTDEYDFTFKILDEAELKVLTRDTDNVETTLVLSTDYTVDGVGDEAGGTITLLAGNLASGTTISMLRGMEFVQETDLISQGTFSPQVHEEAFDRLTMMAQQLKDDGARSLRLSETVDPDDINVELPAPEAGTVIGWNDDEDGLTNIAPGSVSLAIPATNSTTNTMLADMATLTIKGRVTAGTGDPQDLTPSQARDVLDLEPDGTTLEISSGTVRVKDAGIGAAKIANATITGQTGETAPATGDLLLLSDVSATALRKMTLADMLKVINSLTADASPDGAADYLLTYDASASTVKKALINAVVGTAAAASTSAAGIVELATETEVETGTSTSLVSNVRDIVQHLGVAKAWVRFTASGSIIESHNVDSVTDNGAGDWTVVIGTNFVNDDYVWVTSMMGVNGTTTQGITLVASNVNVPTTTALRLLALSISGAKADPDSGGDMCVAMFGRRNI